VIELVEIGKRYNRPAGGEPIHALINVSLTVQRGEFVAITGASGSGKSTLMNVLGLLDEPTAGTYTFDGQNVAHLSPADRARFRNKKVGFVFQAFHLLARTTALENVELPLVYSDRASTDGLGQRALEAVGLGDRMSHKPGELSGGQQQRVAIARALVNETDLILADEPTGNLDPQSANEVLSVLQQLNAAGRTIVLVTHDPIVAGWARRVIRLDAGRVTSDAPSMPTPAAAEMRVAP
jgi:putative ABC transport system ATP-binding protein